VISLKLTHSSKDRNEATCITDGIAKYHNNGGEDRQQMIMRRKIILLVQTPLLRRNPGALIMLAKLSHVPDCFNRKAST